MSRPSVSYFAAAAVVIAGLAGLVRGAVPQQSAAPAPASSGPGIVIGSAYVRQPANLINAAAYFTVYNTTDQPDTLTTVDSGAGAQTTLHVEDASGAMSANAAGLTVPAHGSASLVPGKGHVMIEKLYGRLLAGQTVNLSLTFAHAGQILVTVPVIGVTAPAPTPGGTPK
ncbi:MAG TPA: copper chaperone PCu(A)C [Jatrophihabitans sp.]|nr:copper chaperone PCu(A)C [Jatrophihabitans sp.]